MVDSATAIERSSSPSSSEKSTDTRSQYHSSDEPKELDEDELDELRTKGEGVTVRLLNRFLEYALDHCLVQGDEAEQAWPRREPNTATAYISGHHITAADDGGIRQMSHKRRGWKMVNPFLALIEAKRVFMDIEYDKAGRAHPVVSDETLAQCLGEAVITWKANREFFDQDVFLITATNRYIRFLHFHFGGDYAGYLKAPDERAQKRFVGRNNHDAFVRLQCTKWFNLAEPQGREQAFCHILALLRWHKAQ